MTETRVRFAPSPTGFFHIGSARTALFNWLYARHTGGKFILRIEDTDKERNTEEALQVLIDGMKWLGINWDEGPLVEGPCGPYFQSQRSNIYREWLTKLETAGRTYEKDGAIWFRLEGERSVVYDDYLKKEVEKVAAAPVVIEDAIRGRVERAEDRDFVIFRASGDPVFHFVNVVDDITMGITHVIRGEDHLSNTSKHVELFRAFGADVPTFAHMPLILKEVGQGKMSKRDQGALVEDYQKQHYLSEAVRNYLCLLGWSPKDDREILPIDEIIDLFDLPGITQTNARFDGKKMAFINSHYVRAMPIESFTWLAKPILVEADLIPEDYDEDRLQSILALCQEKVRGLGELAQFARYFFKDDFATDEKALNKVTKKGDPAARLDEAAQALEQLSKFDAESIETAIAAAAEVSGNKPGAYMPLMRVALSGTNVGPSFYPMLEIMGQGCVVDRLRQFRATLS
ncbi:MAG: glutamate--tRNA ligase [Opitutales bacterium]|nr:glutamate--tRNA ligase [Opitutales bacterium]NRA27586.1 glutamate--tRNA ligase [Opitutales bacterium]